MKTPVHCPVTFYRLIEQTKLPFRAARSGAGTLPTRATQYCEAITSASSYGWWIFPPIELSLLWDGVDIHWQCPGLDDWVRLDPSSQFPYFAEAFDECAPAEARGYAPPFMTAFPEPGVVQIWSGLIARSEPEWSLVIRGAVNTPPLSGVTVLEGIVDADSWFGPLFVNVRLTRTGAPIRLASDFPFAQVQPVPRSVLADGILNNVRLVPSMHLWTPEDWRDYATTIIDPSKEQGRSPGRYAIEARRRKRQSCPYHSGEAVA